MGEGRKLESLPILMFQTRPCHNILHPCRKGGYSIYRGCYLYPKPFECPNNINIIRIAIIISFKGLNKSHTCVREVLECM